MMMKKIRLQTDQRCFAMKINNSVLIIKQTGNLPLVQEIHRLVQ
jgi:hypothetical protein